MSNDRIHELTGAWKGRGFVFSIPAVHRPGIREIHVMGAFARVLRVVPGQFYLIVPEDAFEPDKWLVRIDVKEGVLSITPPQEIVNLEGLVEPLGIGFVLPRTQIRIYD